MKLQQQLAQGPGVGGMYLPRRIGVVIQSYWVDAVLQSQDNKSQPVILRLSTPDYINNIPGRSCTTFSDCNTVLKVVCASSCVYVISRAAEVAICRAFIL